MSAALPWRGKMSFWASLFGKKVHCHGCGVVLPSHVKAKDGETYCSDVCRDNYRRLSTMPPHPTHARRTGPGGFSKRFARSLSFTSLESPDEQKPQCDRAALHTARLQPASPLAAFHTPRSLLHPARPSSHHCPPSHANPWHHHAPYP